MCQLLIGIQKPSFMQPPRPRCYLIHKETYVRKEKEKECWVGVYRKVIKVSKWGRCMIYLRWWNQKPPTKDDTLYTKKNTFGEKKKKGVGWVTGVYRKS
jgi:hypothetical protein